MKKSKQTPLWRISGLGLKGISYLLGTMHLKPTVSNQKSVAIYSNYIDLCKVFASEFPLDEVDAALVSRFSVLPDGKKLTDYIPEKKYQKIESQLRKSLGMPLQSLSRMKPLMITNLIAEQIFALHKPISMDRDLWKIAKQKGKELTGIETFEEQIQILQRIPIEYQVKSLISIAKKLGPYKKQLFRLAEVYETGDLQKLQKLSKKSLGGIRYFLLTERNHIMAERIAAKAKEKSMFCAIGAGHLAGKEGVLRLLKQKGFTVKPIKIKKG